MTTSHTPIKIHITIIINIYIILYKQCCNICIQGGGTSDREVSLCTTSLTPDF